MNSQRKAKLKSIILKLPLGAQLLGLKRKIIAWQQQCRQNRQRKLREKLKIRKRMQREKQMIQLIRREIRQEKWEKRQLKKSRLRNQLFYRWRTVDLVSTFQYYSSVPVEQATAFEIGAGLYLIAPIGLSLLGFKKIITVDLKRAKPGNVARVIKYFQKYHAKFGIRHVPKIKNKITDENLDKILLSKFNVDYRAPYDATHTDLPDESIDFVFSQVTFEHIRAELLPDIVKEAFRILHGGGVLYLTIDYKDHRAKSNSTLTIYDYLQYTSAKWSKMRKGGLYLPDIPVQNRLRSADYLAILTAAGFEIIKYKPRPVTDADRAAFATVKVADEFKQKYTDEELLEKGGMFILRKP
ncbi:MAG: methyltransferase domain-containing protein [Prevotella sp.]|nr:methyltransferase domain-containing protein [Prevotella sp.]